MFEVSVILKNVITIQVLKTLNCVNVWMYKLLTPGCKQSGAIILEAILTMISPSDYWTQMYLLFQRACYLIEALAVQGGVY